MGSVRSTSGRCSRLPCGPACRDSHGRPCSAAVGICLFEKEVCNGRLDVRLNVQTHPKLPCPRTFRKHVDTEWLHTHC